MPKEKQLGTRNWQDMRTAPKAVPNLGHRQSDGRDPTLPKESSPAAAPEDVDRLIQEAAYFKAQAREFEAGRELDDWLEAEIEIRRVLT